MTTANAAVPFRPFTNGQLLYLSPHHQAGLILQYPYFASFAGVGAAVGCESDKHCISVYPIGDVCCIAPETYQQRQDAMRQRILYANTLCRIMAVHSPFQRAYLIVRQLCQWLNPKDVQGIPLELVGMLSGVSPEYIKAGWQQYLQHYNAKDPRRVAVSNLGLSRSSPRTDMQTVPVPVAVTPL